MADNKETNQLETAKQGLGLAGATAKAFINSPLTPMLIVIFILMGLTGIAFTPRQEDPQISVPMADIFVQYPGASAEQVAALAAKPLQRIMGEMSGVKHVYAASQRDAAIVTVEFDVGEEMEDSLTKLYSKLDSNKDVMPPGVMGYMVKPKAVDDVPGLTITLWSNEVDDASLRLIALDTLQKLSEVENSNQGFVVSGRKEQLRVEVLPEKLAGYGISLPKLAQVIQQANSEKSVGDIEAWDKSFKVYTGSFLQSAQDVENIVVGIRNGIPVYIRDVANVLHGPSEVHSMVNHYTGPASVETEVADGAPAVTIAIAKKKGSNGVSVYQDILERLELLKGEIIPDNVNVYISRNYGETANDKVNELIFKLFIATGIVTLLVWFALGWRPALVVLIVIPIVILFTVFSALVLGLTIDRVSLFALIFSIGILVDDAIVVIENIYRHWLMKEDMSEEVSIEAVDEVGNPTILATFTVIAALMPMGVVRGMMGPYMAPIPTLGSVAMIFSLFAAFAFTPWLANKIKPSLETLKHHADKEHKSNERLGKFFRNTITPLIENSVLGYGFLMSLFVVFFACCVMFYTTAVSVKMLPLDNKSEFNVVVNFPEGTSLIDTANLMVSLAAEAKQFEDVVSLQTYIGTSSPYNFNGLVRHYYLRTKPWQADMQVVLTHKTTREITSHELAVAMREIMTPIAEKAGARIQVVEMPPGPPVLQSVVAEIYGPDQETRQQFARDMTEMLEKAESVTDVDNLMQQPYEIWRFEADRDKALRKGVTIDSINMTLEMAMGGFVVGDLKRGSVVDPTYIVLQVPLSARSEFSRLGAIPVQAPDGSMLPLSELGSFVKDVEEDIIFHKDLREVEFVTGENAGELAAPIYGMFQVDDMLEDYIAPDGVEVDHGFLGGGYFGPPADSRKTGFEWTGEWTVTYETFRDMGGAFMLAMIIIYMLVVIEFKNFIFPSIIMAPIPLTLVGIIPGHWFFGAEFTATSMIGWIALAGIIVRNS
ncbi:MAG: efflux RND transporter permease subunit, partial [Gammaproteobacteria bacterium]|nr:efflux RND transporter permease subunit [Gammaproteobacteria bacterium]